MTRLPDFIVGGAAKSGTTTLSYNMRQHPEIFMSPIKEPRYFAFDADDPLHQASDRARFPIRTFEEYAALFDDVTTEKAVGESTPTYLFSPTAPYHMREVIPDVKLIFSLRDPVDRAYSAYWHRVRLGHEQRPIQEALTEGEFYVANGLYYEKLTAYYELFAADQIKLILLNDISKNPGTTFKELFRFIGVDDSFVPNMEVKNKGGVQKSRRLGLMLEKAKTHPLRNSLPRLPKPILQAIGGLRTGNFEAPPPMPADLELRLRAFYADEIAKLETLMQRDLSAWRGMDKVAATS